MLKCGQKSLVLCIENLFNIILSTGQFLKEWKIGYINMFLKGYPLKAKTATKK